MDKIKVLNLGLSDSEFCRRLWLENPDPVVQRLLTMMEDLSEWKEAMDDFAEPWEIKDDIRELEDENEYLRAQLSEVNDKLKKLEARTVVDLISDLRLQIYQKDDRARRAEAEKEAAMTSEATMRSKLDMWAVLNS